jgi:hypothetical protein
MSSSDAPRTRNPRENTARRLLFIGLMSVLLFAMASSVVEARAMDSIRNTWSHMRVYVLSGPFWVNAIIIFAVAFILVTLLLSNKLGSDSTQKVMLYIVIGVIAIIIATKFVAANGAPQYLWQNEQFRQFTQFLIGPDAAHQRGPCVAPAHSFWMSMLPFGWGDPNPPCCGAGAYEISVRNRPNPVCKQAILRTNENGSGLPAFIIATILFYLLFSAYAKNLGIDGMGSGGGKWFPIILAVVLGAMMANERVTKNNILIIGGWVALILLGNKLSKTLGGDGGSKDISGSRRGFGFGLAYAFIQLILNMLGTSLWGGSVDATELGSGKIIGNILIGLAFGYVYSLVLGEGGIIRKILKARADKAEKDIEELNKQGKFKEALLRGLPIIGTKYSPVDKAEKLRKKIKEITDDIDMVRRTYAVTTNAALIAELDAKIQRLEDKLAEELRKSP